MQNIIFINSNRFKAMSNPKENTDFADHRADPLQPFVRVES